MSVDDAGDATTAQAEAAEQRARLCSHVKERKLVRVEEVAAEFAMQSRQVVEDIRALERAGELTGVMDDRGKVRFCTASCAGRTLPA